MSNLFKAELSDGIVTLTFTRPDIRNPLSVAVLEELNTVLDGLAAPSRAIIFTGSGDAFASGADLREVAAVRSEDAKVFARRGQELMSRIESLRLKAIAAVNGFCFGGALDLALSCDNRIASPDAKFAHPGAGLGIITGWGGTQRLPRLVGTACANEMFFTALPIDAERALSIGLIDGIAVDALSAALEMAANFEI